MAPNELGRAFDRWRSQNDEDALSEVIDAVEGELLAAARRYARDEATALDLVQSTWHAAISKAWNYDPAQPLVPWLVGFLVVESKRERRRAARGVDVERLVEREVEPPEHAASRSEVASVLRPAVAGLPALYRDVVSLTFERGLEPAEIAAELGRAPGTVRVQLHRGLALLRRALPAGFALGAALTTMRVASAVTLRETLIDAAVARGPEVAREGLRLGRAGASAPASIATLPVALGLVLAVALGAGAWWTIDALSARRAPEAPAPLAAANGAGSRPPAPLAGAADAGRERASLGSHTMQPSTPLAQGVHVVARVEHAELAAGGAFEVALRPADVRDEARAQVLDAGASFDLDVSDWYRATGPRPREFFVVLDTPRCLPATARAYLAPEVLERAIAASGGGARVDISVAFSLARAAGLVTGRAIAPPGSPQDGADERVFVGLFELGSALNPLSEPLEARPADPDGRFVLRARAPGPHMLVATHARARPTSTRFDVRAGEPATLGEFVLETGASITGRVVTPRGTPETRARVEAHLDGAEHVISMHGQPLAWIDGRFETPGRSTATDAQGGFVLAGLAPRAHVAWADLGPAPSGGGAVLAFDVEAPRAPPERVSIEAPIADVVILLRRVRATIEVASGGQPVPRAEVEVVREGARFGSRADDFGRITLVTREPRTIDVHVRATGFEPRNVSIEASAFERGETIALELAPGLAPARVTFEARVPLARAFVELTPRAEIAPEILRDIETREARLETPGTRAGRLDDEGRLAEPLAPGRYTGRIHAPLAPDRLAGGFLPTWFDLELAPGADARVTIEVRLAGRLRFAPPAYKGSATSLKCTIQDARGRQVFTQFTATILRSDARQGRQRSAGLVPGASSESDPLAPGDYFVRIEAPDARAWERALSLEGGQTLDVEVVLEDP